MTNNTLRYSIWTTRSNSTYLKIVKLIKNKSTFAARDILYSEVKREIDKTIYSELDAIFDFVSHICKKESN